MSVVAAVGYISLAIIGVFLNTAMIIVIKRDKSMKNHTYKFMCLLAAGDIESLAGLLLRWVLLLLGIFDVDNFLVRLGQYIGAAGFRLSAFWIIFAACSRWVTVGRVNIVNIFFGSKSSSVMCAVLVIGVHFIYSPFLFVQDSFIPDSESSAYGTANSTVSFLIRIFDEAHNYGSAILQILFNGLAFSAIIKLRKQIMTPEVRSMYRKDVNLYIQCAIDSTIYCLFAICGYILSYTSYVNVWMILAIETLFCINHIDCALLYLYFNRKVRVGFLSLLKSSAGFPPTNAVSSIAPRNVMVDSRM